MTARRWLWLRGICAAVPLSEGGAGAAYYRRCGTAASGEAALVQEATLLPGKRRMTRALPEMTGCVYGFFVQGNPKTKGSKRPMPIYRGRKGEPREFTGRVVALDDNRSALLDWEAHVRWQAARHKTEAGGGPVLDEPLELSLLFRLQKPKNRPKRRRTWPDKAPDLDKLIRAVKDAISGVIYRDDALVCRYGAVEKDWGDPPGVWILVKRLLSETGE